MPTKKSEFNVVIRPILYMIVILTIVGSIGYFTLGEKEDTIQGQVECTEYRVSSKIPGRIMELYVTEGQKVEQGDTLVRLDAPEILAKMEQAQGAQRAAEAMSEKARKGTRDEQIQGALELWKKAQAGVTIAKKSYDRIKHLFDEGVVPAQKLDEVTAQRDAAIATEQAAKAQYNMAMNGAQREDKLAAAAMVEKSKGAVAEVNSYIKETILTASAAGEISEIFPKVGELVGTGSPIMNVSRLDDIWVSFNVREDLLSRLQMGTQIKGFVPALGNKEILLKTYYIKDRGTYAIWKATQSTGGYDLKTFEVKARPTEKTEGLRPGMAIVLRK